MRNGKAAAWPSEHSPQTDEMEARLFSAKPLGVLRLAAAFPIPAVLTYAGEGPGRQQAAALRGQQGVASPELSYPVPMGPTPPPTTPEAWGSDTLTPAHRPASRPTVMAVTLPAGITHPYVI